MDVVGDTRQRTLGTKKALRFLSCYASRWPRFTRTSEVWLSSSCIHIHFHLRVLSVGPKYLRSNQYQPKDGLRPARVSGKLASLGGTEDIGVIEERFSIAVVASQLADMPSYTIVYLSDSGYRRLFMESERPLDMPSRGRFTGVAVYLRALRSILPIWTRKWVETLNEVDNLLGVKIDDLFDPKQDSGQMMFDSTFERSRLYFTVLQTLRIISEWIQQSERELQELKKDFGISAQHHMAPRGSLGPNPGGVSPNAFMKEIDEAWEELITIHSSTSKHLLDRIEKKELEIKSFRDGLLSATSVREASRATVLNQYIFVFTIVTIFYLPLSYVSSLFSMGIFPYSDIAESQSSFILTTITTALLTWVVSAVVLWVVHDDRRLSSFMWLIRILCWGPICPPRRHKFKEEGPGSIFQGV
ncbi:hypothetical protein F5Y05DRAFT_313052 [Hypoxylon sp. FL0543]|nr:hypothetical protein F5Y05DRAFT_313052 [Hypoxylon sp. FL0543]